MADLIDRDAVIKQIAETQDKVSSGIEDVTFYRAIKIIRNAPAVNRWIPCSERLPGRFDSVLLAILSKNGYGEPAYYVTIGGMKNGTEFESYTGDICECEKVTHWMPLPEPPESEARNG